MALAVVYTPTGFEKYSCTYNVGDYRIHFVVWDTSAVELNTTSALANYTTEAECFETFPILSANFGGEKLFTRSTPSPLIPPTLQLNSPGCGWRLVVFSRRGGEGGEGFQLLRGYFKMLYLLSYRVTATSGENILHLESLFSTEEDASTHLKCPTHG
uniref:Uncharacterized protein n=1 Tax=Timema shepardi TaxID=629360 RepID=A0A7R9B1K1_TIMSH|nr:unnamed protein product [Timema shepardi]